MSEHTTWSLDERRLYLCTPDRPDLEHFVAECVAGGVDIVQLREKDLDARPLIARGRTLARVCADLGVPFILNDRPDLALEIGADGVHVGQDDAPAALARRIVGEDRIVGLSTHRPGELSSSIDEPVDYISAGPVVATPTKPGREGTGAAYITEAASRSKVPFFVTGGVSPESIPALVDAGARHFVVVRYLTESDDPRHSAARLITSINEATARALEPPG